MAPDWEICGSLTLVSYRTFYVVQLTLLMCFFNKETMVKTKEEKFMMCYFTALWYSDLNILCFYCFYAGIIDVHCEFCGLQIAQQVLSHRVLVQLNFTCLAVTWIFRICFVCLFSYSLSILLFSHFFLKVIKIKPVVIIYIMVILLLTHCYWGWHVHTYHTHCEFSY